MTNFLFRFRNSVSGKILINTGWATAATPLSVALGVIQVGLMARMLGPDGIGTFTLIGAVCALLGSIFKITSSETIMVYASKAETLDSRTDLSHTIRFCFWVDGLSSLIAYASVFISAFFIPVLLKLSPRMVWLQVAYGLTIIFESTYWTSHGLLRVANRFSWTFYHSCFHSIVKTSLMALLFVYDFGITAVVWLFVIVSFLDGSSLMILSILSIHKKGVYLKNDIQHWWQIPHEIRHYIILAHLRQIVKSLNRYVDNLVIGYIGNPIQVGYYRTGKQVSEHVITPIQGFVVSLFPEYSRLYFSGDREKLKRLVVKFSGLFLGLSTVVCIVLWFNSDLIIKIIFGERFLPASDVLRIMILSIFIIYVMIPVYFLPAAVGNAGPALKSATAATCVQMIFMFYLVPRYGALGAAWANVVYNIVWFAILLPSILAVLRHSTDELKIRN